MKPRIYSVIIFAALAFVFLPACTMFNSHDSHRSTSIVSFLYPNKQPFVEPSIPTLSLPMRVGVVFVPASSTTGAHQWQGEFGGHALSEASRNALIRSVSDQFKKLPYVSGIEVIPTHYLRAGGSFDNLDQLRSLLGIDVVVLLAYDQQQNTTDTPWVLSYWTIVGAYTVPAQKNTTATLMEAVVYDIASRKMLFRAAGTNIIKHNSTFVGTEDQLLNDSGQSFKAATDDMGANLQSELASFKVRIKESPEEVKVVAKPGYNLAAGALGAWELAIAALFGITIMIVRADRRAKINEIGGGRTS